MSWFKKSYKKEFEEFLLQKKGLSQKLETFTKDLNSELNVVRTLNTGIKRLESVFEKYSSVGEMDFNDAQQERFLNDLTQTLVHTSEEIRNLLKDEKAGSVWLFEQKLKIRLHNIKFLVKEFNIDKWDSNPDKIVKKIYDNLPYDSNLKSSAEDTRLASSLKEAYKEVLFFNHDLNNLIQKVENKNGKYNSLLAVDISPISYKRNHTISVENFIPALTNFLQRDDMLVSKISIKKALMGVTEHAMVCAKMIIKGHQILKLYLEFLNEEEGLLNSYKTKLDNLITQSRNLHQKDEGEIQEGKKHRGAI